MKLHLTTQEMLAEWRLLRGYEPVMNGNITTRTDRPSLDDLLKAEIDAWYSELLDTAEPEFLSLTDISSQILLEKENDGSVTARVPENVRRVLSITLAGWDRPSIPVSVAEAEILVNRQSNPFSQAGTSEPVAIVFPGNTLRLYSLPSSASRPHLTEAVAVVEPENGYYDFDSRALSLIPKFDILP